MYYGEKILSIFIITALLYWFFIRNSLDTLYAEKRDELKVSLSKLSASLREPTGADILDEEQFMKILPAFDACNYTFGLFLHAVYLKAYQDLEVSDDRDADLVKHVVIKELFDRGIISKDEYERLLDQFEVVSNLEYSRWWETKNYKPEYFESSLLQISSFYDTMESVITKIEEAHNDAML